MEHKEIQVKLSDGKDYRLHFVDWGNPADKTLICVHGLTRNCRDFDYLARELSRAHGYRVIAIDMPGRGRSEYLPDAKLYNYENYRLATLSLLKALELKSIDYLGSSMGGILSMYLANNQPHLFNKLILNDVGTFLPKNPLARIARYTSVFPSFDDYAQAKAHIKTKLAHFGIRSEENWDYVTEHSVHLNSENRLELDYDLKVTQSLQVFNSEDAYDVDLSKLWQKVKYKKLLILRGKKSDLFTHENALAMVEGKDNASLIEFEDVGHAPALMEKDQLSKVIEWLSD